MAGPISSPEFIGPAHELALLDSLLAQSSGREGTLALVAGEAGIGKSRLIAEVGARARGMAVLVGDMSRARRRRASLCTVDWRAEVAPA